MFHFKRFSVSHAKSSMKVGVDGVLIALWATQTRGIVLDAGTGCGVISMILAQRMPEARIYGIDIDADSIAEAEVNFDSSPWNDRLSAHLMSFESVAHRAADFSIRDIFGNDCREASQEKEYGTGFDLLISNPPFYDSGVNDFSTARNSARHVGRLSPESLIVNAGIILKEEGMLCMIFPAEQFPELLNKAKDSALSLTRAMYVRDHPGAKVKRAMAEFTRNPAEENLEISSIPTLTLFDELRRPTEDYLLLGKEFYLKF